MTPVQSDVQEPSAITPGRRKIRHKPTILVLDDDIAIVRWLHTSLSSFGYEVLDATEPNRTLLLLASFVVDAVILDVQLEASSGLDVLEFIRSEPSLAHLPVIVLTGLELTHEREETIRQGHAHLIQKSEGIDAVVTTLDGLLEYPDKTW